MRVNEYNELANISLSNNTHISNFVDISKFNRSNEMNHLESFRRFNNNSD